jgi:hypothetical protein
MVASGSPRQVGDLLTLARTRFGGLSQAEVRLLEAAPRGQGSTPSGSRGWEFGACL